MEENKSHIEDLFTDYFVRNISDEDLEKLKVWVSASPENRRHFLNMQEIWFSTNSIVQDDDLFNKDEAYHRFLQHTKKPAKTFIPILWRSVAAAVLLILVSYISFKQGNELVKNQFADITVEAPWGSRSKIFLPDGTLVWLNAGSTMVYSQGFGVDDRNIHLTGEGYFEVIRNENLPFSVKTNEMHVDVLGTKFNVRNYADNKEATISLLEGSVLVGNDILKGENLKMEPGQKVFLDKVNGHMHIVNVNAQNTIEWTNGYLFFDEELIFDIAKELERCYNVKITITHPDIEKLRFYGKFNYRDMSIEEVLGTLSLTGKIKYTINGKEIKLSPS